MTQIKDLPIHAYIISALKDLNFQELTEVQEKVIPQALAGKDLIVQSQTGSGKSHSFLIPMIQAIDSELQEVQTVITAPSRELAEQLYDMTMQILAFSGQTISVGKFIGGTDKQRQLEKLQASQPQIVIGTPGRIFDLMSENALWVQTSRTLIIDEADMTMDLGFLSVMDEIASRMPKNLQIMVFSATIPQGLQVFLSKYLRQPEFIKIEQAQEIGDNIANYLLPIRSRSRKELVYQLLTIGQPYLALIFCNTKKYADEISDYLKEAGLKVATIHGDIPPRERKRVMKQIRDLQYQYVVATDLAARGIDIPGTSLVINMEIPKETEFFIHRVGRTGRNQIAGSAYTLIAPDDMEMIEDLEKKGIQFTEVDIVNNEIKTIAKRQYKRTKANEVTPDQHRIKGLVNRAKKAKVKPGYKRKLKSDIQSAQKRKGRK